MTTIASELSRLGACPEAVEWAGRRRIASRAWAACPRGDWLLWYAEQVGADCQDLVRAAAACASLVLHLVPAGDDRPRLAIEAAEAWAATAPGSKAQAAAAADVEVAAEAWAAVGEAAAVEAAAAAAWAATGAKGTAWGAARAASAAAAAATAASAAAAAATAVEAAVEAGAARAEMHCRCARAVRRCVPFPGAPSEGAT